MYRPSLFWSRRLRSHCGKTGRLHLGHFPSGQQMLPWSEIRGFPAMKITGKNTKLRLSGIRNGRRTPTNLSPTHLFMKKPHCPVVVAATCLGFLSLLATVADAAPYGPTGRLTQWRQPDGRIVNLRVYGDELYGRTETLSGYTVVYNSADRSYRYANKAPDGMSLVPTNTRAHLGVPSGIGKGLRLSKERELQIRQENQDKYAGGLNEDWQQRVAARANKNAGGRSTKALIDGAAAVPIIGNRIGLTLLVQFPDDPSTTASDGRKFALQQEKIIRYCNGGAKADTPPYLQDFAPYTDDRNTGSIYEYFYDQSNGLLKYTQLVSPILTLPYPRAYYNFADYPYNSTLRDAGDSGRTLLLDAVTLLREVPGFDVSDLSTDGDSRVIATNLFFAGEDSGVWAAGLWPHSYFIENPLNVSTDDEDPKLIYNYQVTNLPDGAPKIGTFIHENGHLLCRFPDLYDYSGTTGGVGFHCIMAAGNYNNQERTPAPLNLHLKDMCGWAKITTHAAGGQFTFPTTGNIGRKVVNPDEPMEYFLIENRGIGDRWAEGCPDRGIAIWHIREDKEGNTIDGDGDFYHVALEQADGLFEFERSASEYGDNTDLFDLKYSYFADLASPTARWYDATGKQTVNSGLKLKVKSDPGPNVVVELNATIAANTVIVSVLNGGETVYTGDQVPLWWSASVTGNVKVELFKGGVFHSVIAASVPAVIPGTTYGNGTTTWAVPTSLPAGNDYTIKVTSLTTPAANDVSDASFTVGTTTPLASALDSPDLSWTTGGDAVWVGVTERSHDGVDSAASGVLNVDKRCWMETTVQGPGTLTYWAKVSGEYGYDFLELYLNGTLQPGRLSGEVDWVQKTVQIPWGTTIVRLQFNNDYDRVNGLNRAYIDEIAYTRTPVPDIVVEDPSSVPLVDGAGTADLGAVSVKTTRSALLTIRNAGDAPLTGLSVKLKKVTGGTFRVGVLGSTSLDPGQSTTLPVFLTPGKAGLQKASIQIASNDQDENPFDINLVGTGVLLPEIAVEYPSRVNLVDGSALVSCGSAPVGGSTSALTITIRNSGSASLTGVLASFDGMDASAFQLVSSPSSTIGSGRTATFKVAYRPTAVGAQATTLKIASNDADENPFDITLTGTGTSILLSAPAAGKVASAMSVASPGQPALASGLGSLQLPWQVANMSSLSVAGTAVASVNMLSVSGAGALSAGISDAGCFVYQTLTGDGSIVARVVATDSADPSGALSGIQIRESLASGNAMATIALGGSGNCSWMSRAAAGEVSSAVSVAGAGSWLKLTRAGNRITASRSADGVTWLEVGALDLVMPENCHIGIVSGSGSSQVVSKAIFDNVVVTP